MNLSPYILARLFSWKIGEDERRDKANELLDQQADLYRSLSVVAFLQITDLENLKSGAPWPFGLLRLKRETWERMLERVEKTEPNELPERFVRGIYINDKESVVLFPDDSGIDARISIFCPAPDSQNSIVLHTASFFRAPSAPEVAIDDGDCSVKISGDFPDRVFSCGRTGCSYDCKEIKRVERKTTILDCKC